MKISVLKSYSAQLKALGHTKRLEIVCLLQGHSLTVGQIAQMTALRQAAVSQHLMLLKDQGLVQASQLGKEIYYTLRGDSLTGLAVLTKNLTRINPLEDAEPTVIDPICHMHLTPSTSDHTREYDGVRHYFCGKGCLKQFNNSHRGSL